MGIDVGYHGWAVSKSASLMLRNSSVLDALNEQNLTEWVALNNAVGIRNSPLSVYLHVDQAAEYPCSVDGTRICNETGFHYEKAALGADLLKDIIDGYRELKLWPE